MTDSRSFFIFCPGLSHTSDGPNLYVHTDPPPQAYLSYHRKTYPINGAIKTYR